MAHFKILEVPLSDRSEAELRAQHRSLRQQIPLMYIMMSINVVFLGTVTRGEVPLIVSVGIPAALLTITGIRAVMWARRRRENLTVAQIRRQLRGTIVAAAALSTMFGAWGVWLLAQVNPYYVPSVALFVFVGSIGCCYCLQALPIAAKLVLVLGGAPVTLHMMFSGDPYRFGISITFFFVALLILQALAGMRSTVLELLRSRAKMGNLLTALQRSEEHYRHAIELNPQIPWIAERSGAIVELSPRWSVLTGMSITQGLGAGWLSAMHPDDLPVLRNAWGEALKEGGNASVDIRYRLRQADSSYRWFRAQANALLDENGGVIRWYGNLEDIDDQVSAEQALRESEERYRLASRATKDVIWDWSPATGRIQWAGDVDSIFGYADAAKGTSIAWWMERVHPDDLGDVLELYQRVLANSQDSWAHEHRFRAANGEYIDVFSRGYAIRDEQGNAVRAIGAMSDITLAKRAEDDLRWAAYHDPLTDLPNRKFAAEELSRALKIAGERETCVGVIVVDVDGFKSINDSLGHAAGDTVLKTVATRLLANVPEGATVARLGGDEFAVILPNFMRQDATAETLNDILGGVGRAIVIDEAVTDVKLSAGAAMWPVDGVTAEDVMKSADLALYVAKAEGAGSMRGFLPEMRKRIEDRSRMLGDAREALDDDRVIPFYQPKIALGSGAVIGFEALLRWHHHRNGLQPPASIQAAFEDAALSRRLTDGMLDRVLGDMRVWQEQGVPFGRIAINGSPADFRRDNLAERILTRCHKAGIAPSLLELEVTETVLLGQFADTVERALTTLRCEGVAIALDDFGTGFASLSHLQQFPVNVLKIDRSFVSRLDDTNSVGFAIVQGVIGIARQLAIDTVAEGIETDAQAGVLRQLGCHIGQGFLFSRAVSANQVPRFLSEWTERSAAWRQQLRSLASDRAAPRSL